ncbi:MAG: TonB-dependent receptor [Tannerella sp.]|jgi:outer membrane receptor protein involved in Fe transport|nr:TonB-dependent receptor [Tannerella sp.]
MIKHLFIHLFILTTLPFSPVAMAGEKIKGYVYDEKNETVAGANVSWHETHSGTITNADGFFELEQKANEKQLVVSYVGYTTATITVDNYGEPLRIILKGEIELDEVVVNERRTGTISSRTSVLQTQKITYEELSRAACCNLAESFETNPSVDVSYSDASTGARQIKLLGLSGTYVQMLTENYPNFRGASSLYGLDYIPGPWMESIQVSKGTSSVKNGYEALAGQINVEYKKPATADIFSANLFAGDAGRYEANSDASRHINDNLSTGLFVHYSSDEVQHDSNGDGFLNYPLKKQVNLMNRWQHRINNYVAQYGIRYLHEDRTGGQDTKHHDFTDPYRIRINTNRVEGFTKQAYIINPDKVESVALIVSGSYHEQQSMYDRTPYNIYQDNLYASLMYEKEFAPMHSLSTGLSLNYDGFDENLTLNRDRSVFDRNEVVPGVYAQYTYNLHDKFIVLAGIRADRSSIYDFFATPRIHLKYNPFDWFHVRASAGKGFRTANVLAENNFLLASSRKITIADKLDQEEAWNTGVNFSFYIPIAGKDLTINTEWYYTNFDKQVVIDMDSDPHEVSFYNLNGKSYSNSFQVEATYPFPFFRGFTLTGAYRYTDAKTDYRNQDGTVRRLKKPLTSGYKGLITASYQTPLKKWQADLTGQFNGGGRMPVPDAANPLWDTDFSSYQVWNAQVTRYFRQWSVYIGSENLFDFMQEKPIIDAANPRGENFDGSMIWGPVHGRKIYIGLRFNIARY